MSKTLAEIKTGLEGFTGVTSVTPSSFYSTSSGIAGKLYSGALGEVIANVTDGTTVALLIDNTGATGYFKSEMADPKAWLADTIINGAGNVTDPQTGLTYVCNSFGHPYNVSCADSRLAAIALGFTSSRGYHTAWTTIKCTAPVLDIYQIYDSFGGTQLSGDGTDDSVRLNAAAIAFFVAQTGTCVSFTKHSTSELTLAQWDLVLDEWKKWGNSIHVCSMQQYAQAIRAGWTDNLDGTFSRDFSGEANYKLDTGSPCIGAGDESIQATVPTDFEDKANYNETNGMSIGPYRGWSTGSHNLPGN